MKKKLFILLYYGIARYLPDSYVPILGGVSNRFRIACVRRIFKKCGKVSTICRMVYFGNGKDVEIGDNSGIGTNNRIPNNIKIGNDVMMGPDIYIPANNHNFDRIDIPMRIQGTSNSKPVIIEDDCWIGARVIITPGKRICKGAIVGAGSVVTCSVENYSVVGVNPARIIRNRKNNGESTNC